jgi:hypothetical protein
MQQKDAPLATSCPRPVRAMAVQAASAERTLGVFLWFGLLALLFTLGALE